MVRAALPAPLNLSHCSSPGEAVSSGLFLCRTQAQRDNGQEKRGLWELPVLLGMHIIYVRNYKSLSQPHSGVFQTTPRWLIHLPRLPSCTPHLPATSDPSCWPHQYISPVTCRGFILATVSSSWEPWFLLASSAAVWPCPPDSQCPWRVMESSSVAADFQLQPTNMLSPGRETLPTDLC